MHRCAASLVFIALVLMATSTGHAEEAVRSTNTSQSLAPKVYIDCDDCDEDYLRTEIGCVNFVRDRKQADVHVLVSAQETGSGGERYTLEFIGLGTHEGQADTLRFSVLDSDSDDTIRKKMAESILIGMVRYVARTPLVKYLTVEYSQSSASEEVVDKWNYWVFEVSGRSWFSGEESYRSLNLFGDIEAQRVTEASKVRLRIYGNYDESKFEYEEDGEMISTLSLSRSKGMNGHWILSINDHWSAGVSASAYSSTYSNRDYDISAGPALEYNIFPYEESTRRQFRFVYRNRPSYVDYTEETIFEKTHEWLWSHSLSAELELIQPWGSMTSELSGSHFFHDFAKNHVTWWNRLSLRLVKGFSLNLSGNVSRIRNLLSLPKGGATEEEVLLRRQQLATGYRYWGSVGISYSFGSIYNNVVNPRFGN